MDGSLAGGDVLGVLPDGTDAKKATAGNRGPVMQVVHDIRRLLRERKLFDLTDVLRDELARTGIGLAVWPRPAGLHSPW